jgi:hypothetical protein
MPFYTNAFPKQTGYIPRLSSSAGSGDSGANKADEAAQQAQQQPASPTGRRRVRIHFIASCIQAATGVAQDAPPSCDGLRAIHIPLSLHEIFYPALLNVYNGVADTATRITVLSRRRPFRRPLGSKTWFH